MLELIDRFLFSPLHWKLALENNMPEPVVSMLHSFNHLYEINLWPKTRDNVISLVKNKKKKKNFSVKATSFSYLWPKKDPRWKGRDLYNRYYNLQRTPIIYFNFTNACVLYVHLFLFNRTGTVESNKFARGPMQFGKNSNKPCYPNGRLLQRLRAVRRILYARDEIKLRFHSRASQHTLISTLLRSLPRSRVDAAPSRDPRPRPWFRDAGQKILVNTGQWP